MEDLMFKGLMSICKNWAEEGCHPDISKWRFPAEIGGGEEIPTLPVGEELKKLNGKDHREFEFMKVPEFGMCYAPLFL